MIKSFLTYILTFLLFLGPVVLAVFGWPVEGDSVSTLRLYPAYYILSVYLFVFFFRGGMKKKGFRAAWMMIGLVLVWYFVCKLFGMYLSKMVLLNSMVLPAMYYIFYNSLHEEKLKKRVKLLLLSMFLLNTLFAIYERLTLTLWFPFDLIRTDFSLDEVNDYSIFRSSALLGHPLTNALLMAIIMVFILTSRLKFAWKYLLFFVGLFGLFCFNSRASIMISGGVLGLYLLHSTFNKGVSFMHRLFALFMLILSGGIALYMLNAGFGGRFEEQGEFSSDSSTLARVQVWDIFLKGDLTDFLWGMSGDDVEAIAMRTMGIIHIENWFILSSMVVGLVLTSIVVILFIPLFKKVLKPYDRFSTFLILLVVVGLSSTNNSLACGVQAIAMFFACAYAFREERESPVKKVKEKSSETREVALA